MTKTKTMTQKECEKSAGATTGHMSLSKCSPWFGEHGVVKILAQWFEVDDTQTQAQKHRLDTSFQVM